MSVLEVQEEDGFEEKVWGKGDGGRDWRGVEAGVEEREERVDWTQGGKRKLWPEELLAAVKGCLYLRWDVAALAKGSVESALDELS